MQRRTAQYDYDVPKPGTYDLPVIQAAADGRVLNTDGVPVQLHELMEERVVILSFIYTRCTDPKACLLASSVLSKVQQMSGDYPEIRDRLLLLTLSFDPESDTPEVMARYGRIFQDEQQTAEWLFLTTRGPQDLEPLLNAYGQRVDRANTPDANGPLKHNLRVYLVDQKQQIRNIYSYGLLDPRLVMTDVLTIAR